MSFPFPFFFFLVGGGGGAKKSAFASLLLERLTPFEGNNLVCFRVFIHRSFLAAWPNAEGGPLWFRSGGSVHEGLGCSCFPQTERAAGWARKLETSPTENHVPLASFRL